MTQHLFDLVNALLLGFALGTAVCTFLVRRWRRVRPLEPDDVQWIVNDIAELGVRVHGRCFFLYKSRSYKGGAKWRPIWKREFGETVRPLEFRGKALPETYAGWGGEPLNEWKEIE